MNNDRIMSTKYVNVFVLGAGASVDYGLPVWAELKELLTKHFRENRVSTISTEKSNRYLEELEEIGPGKKYATVDEMISKFSRSMEEFDVETQAFFEEVKIIFRSRVMSEKVGWIEKFVKKNDVEVLLHNELSDNPTVFINFNYDTLLLIKIVEFFNNIYSKTAYPERGEWYAKTGRHYERKFEYCAKDIFHPHGVLYLFDRDRIRIGKKTLCYPTTKTCINSRTSGHEPLVTSFGTGGDNAISCHDAHDEFTFVDIKARIRALGGGGQGNVGIRLIVLGVGPNSLAFNLNKIFNGQKFPVKQVHYTCTKEDEKHVYEQYLNRFKAATESYEDCQELVEKNTFIPFN